METSKEGQTGFVAEINRSLRESSRENHPAEEEIFMFALGALSESRCSEMEKHLEFCCYCGEVLADAELLGKEFIRNLDPEIPMPTFSEFCSQRENVSPNRGRSQDAIFVPKRHPERTKEATGKSRPETPAALLAWLRGLAPQPGFVGASTGVADGITPVFWEHDGVERESDLTWKQDDDGIEVYTTDEALVGRTLILKVGGTVLNGEFEWDPTEGYCASAFLLVEDAAIFRDLHDVVGCSLEVS